MQKTFLWLKFYTVTHDKVEKKFTVKLLNYFNIQDALLTALHHGDIPYRAFIKFNNVSIELEILFYKLSYAGWRLQSGHSVVVDKNLQIVSIK